MLLSLFDYPDQAAEKQPQELVLLRQWDDSQWAVLIKHAEMRAFKTGDVVIRTEVKVEHLAGVILAMRASR